MKKFVLSIVYKEQSDTSMSCDEARATKWHKQKKKTTLGLPPDEDALNQHLE